MVDGTGRRGHWSTCATNSRPTTQCAQKSRGKFLLAFPFYISMKNSTVRNRTAHFSASSPYKPMYKSQRQLYPPPQRPSEVSPNPNPITLKRNGVAQQRDSSWHPPLYRYKLYPHRGLQRYHPTPTLTLTLTALTTARAPTLAALTSALTLAALTTALPRLRRPRRACAKVRTAEVVYHRASLRWRHLTRQS